MPLRRLLTTVTTALCLSTGSLALHAADDTPLAQALKAVDEGELAQFNRLRQTLSQHPLSGYLDYRFLLARLDQSEPRAIKHFLSAWGDTPWGTRLQHRWLLHQGQQKNWPQLLEVQQSAPKSTELQCYYYRAQLETGQQKTAFTGASKLWLSGQSRPDSCDPLFDALKTADQLTPELIEKRFYLAFADSNLTLMRYLVKLSDQPQRSVQEQLVSLHQNPAKLSKEPLPLSSKTERSQTQHLLMRWLRKDATAAIAYWEQIKKQFPETEQVQFEIKAARYLLARYRFEPADWLNRVVKTHSPHSRDLRQLGLRGALAQADWGTVALLGKGQSEPYFRYWRLRALEQQGRISQSGLKRHLGKLVDERSFYALQAAERTQQPFLPKTQTTLSDPERYQKVTSLPRFQRIEAFIDAGLDFEARAEWEYLLARLSNEALAAAAQLAKERQWGYFGIRNAVKGGFFDDLELRFPLMFSEQIRHAAQQRSLDNSLVFAIARQESAFWPTARSHVGARGLMQLMPATARETAKRWKVPLKKMSDLDQPEVNLLLGSSYLAGLLKRFDGDTARAAAAYNAGPHRVARWDKERGDLPLDAWVETIPFRETRNYVQNVLVYQAIYQLRQQQHKQLALKANPSHKNQPL